jgi:two-component system phosphate regulon response regulator PhoB
VCLECLNPSRRTRQGRTGGTPNVALARLLFEEANGGRMPKKKMLIADDSRYSHEIYTSFFGDEFEYLHAYDGAEALLVAIDRLPDLIILDLMMPLLDGRSICKKLKSYPKTKDIKIIMVTAKNSQSDRLVGFEVGADDYLEKPCSMDLLARSLKNLLA